MKLFEFGDRGENEAISSQMRHEKRSLAALNEHFRNESWLEMVRLQPDFQTQTTSSNL